MRITRLILAVMIACTACSSDDKKQKEVPQIPFDAARWQVTDSAGKNFVYRRQMVNDLLNNHKWAGLHKDSVIALLGKPDMLEENSLFYIYDKKAFLLGTAIETIVFEMMPDSQTVKLARLNDGGWD